MVIGWFGVLVGLLGLVSINRPSQLMSCNVCWVSWQLVGFYVFRLVDHWLAHWSWWVGLLGLVSRPSWWGLWVSWLALPQASASPTVHDPANQPTNCFNPLWPQFLSTQRQYWVIPWNCQMESKSVNQSLKQSWAVHIKMLLSHISKQGFQ